MDNVWELIDKAVLVIDNIRGLMDNPTDNGQDTGVNRQVRLGNGQHTEINRQSRPGNRQHRRVNGQPCC